MVTDYQVRILMKLIHQSKTLNAAAKAGMSEKTARFLVFFTPFQAKSDVMASY